MPNWPILTAICIDCRTAFRDGERCDWLTHQIADLGSPEDVSHLMEVVWGPNVDRQDYSAWQVLGAFLMLPFLLVPQLGAPLIIAFSEKSGATLATKSVSKRKHRRPEGACEGPARLYYKAPIVGRVVANSTRRSPIMQTDCVAYGVTVIGAPAKERPVLLRDDYTLPFSIECHDGRIVDIDGGRADVMTPGERTSKRDAHDYIAKLRPPSLPVGEPSPFEAACVFEASVRPGDTIALFNDVVVEANTHALSTPYRQAAATREMAKGTPCIEVRD